MISSYDARPQSDELRANLKGDERKLRQELFIRVCRDSRFKMDAIAAAQFVARMLKCSPLEIWMAFPSLSVMDEIAAGTHPAVSRHAI